MIERIFVGLGANLGDPWVALQAALAALARLPHTELLAVSPFYRTAPVEAAGPDFINAVAELKSSLEPLDLLRAMQRIEAAHGRQRPYRNAPRTLDLDLLLVGQQVIDSPLSQPVLHLPHPRLHQRAFVLRPLLDLAPDVQHPLLGPLRDQLPAVADQVLQRLSPSEGAAPIQRWQGTPAAIAPALPGSAAEVAGVVVTEVATEVATGFPADAAANVDVRA